MSLSHFRVIVTVTLCAALIVSCSKDSTDSNDPVEAKTFAGKIISIDESEVSWEGLKFGLISSSTLEVMGQTQYFAGEAYCLADIGEDSTFSFTLPAQIDSRWVFMGYSAILGPTAFNDTNGNGNLDEGEPYCNLYEDGQDMRLFLYVSDPAQLEEYLGWSVSVGWNYYDSPSVYLSDFDREFMMGVYSP